MHHDNACIIEVESQLLLLSANEIRRAYLKVCSCWESNSVDHVFCNQNRQDILWKSNSIAKLILREDPRLIARIPMPSAPCLLYFADSRSFLCRHPGCLYEATTIGHLHQHAAIHSGLSEWSGLIEGCLSMLMFSNLIFIRRGLAYWTAECLTSLYKVEQWQWKESR